MPRVVLRPQRLNDLVEEVLSLYAAPRESGVVIEKRLAEGLPEVEVDGDQLKRVLLNLLKNGVESLPEGKGTISVSTEKLEERGMLGISLRDDGTGIEDVEKIFEPYYTTKVKGTGLGLIISRQIIEEHGGEIEVRSEVGKGTEVRILLPPRRTRREREEEHEVKT
jgi:two-component system NtrC family sensor kinase